ncbi:MAG: acyl-CoA carboxylase subunit epsilon [Actinomycetota bacterium]|nr:MAG: acyl-CoA carboxylase subunit epsilon [Actinomycetota bacterium]
MSSGDEPGRPVLRLVRGSATPEEIAALVAVVTAAARAPQPEPAAPASQWASPWRQVRRPLQVGPAGWWASTLPR